MFLQCDHESLHTTAAAVSGQTTEAAVHPGSAQGVAPDCWWHRENRLRRRRTLGENTDRSRCQVDTAIPHDGRAAICIETVRELHFAQQKYDCPFHIREIGGKLRVGAATRDASERSTRGDDFDRCAREHRQRYGQNEKLVERRLYDVAGACVDGRQRATQQNTNFRFLREMLSVGCLCRISRIEVCALR